MVNWSFGNYQFTSALIGDMARGRLASKLRWTSHPTGTIDGLLMFGPDGRLYPALISGVTSIPRSATQGCWPERRGRIVVRFAMPTSIYTWELRIGYLWYSPGPSWITVRYGGITQVLEVRHGLHSGYLPVTGSVRSITLGNLSNDRMCIGDVEAGTLGPSSAGPAIPPVSG